MDNTKAPVKSKDVILFDFQNLHLFLDFLEKGNTKSHSEINDIKIKLRVINDIQNELKEIRHTMQVYNGKFEYCENTLMNHHNKLKDFEIDSIEKKEKINKLDEKCDNMNTELQKFDEKLTILDRKVESNVFNLGCLKEETTNIKSKIIIHEDEISKHQKEIQKIKEETKKIAEIETKIEKSKTKNKKKLNKFKNAIHDLTIKSTQKFKNLDSNFQGIAKILMSNQKSEEISQQTNLLDNQLQEIMDNKIDFELESPFESDLEEFKKEINIHLQEMKTDINRFNIEFEKIKQEKVIHERKSKTHQELDIDTIINKEVIEKINYVHNNLKEIKDNEKLMLEAISYKVGSEELNKSNKYFLLEIEKLNQNIIRLNKVMNPSNNLQIKPIKEAKISIQELLPQLNSVNLIGGMEEMKRVMIDSVKEAEVISKLLNGAETHEASIEKLSKMVAEIQNKLDFIDLNSPENKIFSDRILNLEENNRILKLMIEDIKGEHIMQNEPDTPTDKKNGEKEGFLNSPGRDLHGMSLKECIKSMSSTLNLHSDKIERIHMKIDNITQELLVKIKKDLVNDSTRILDEFRSDLKISISRIENRMSDKVDRFNLDEFNKKLENKLFMEISKKLDRVDLKRNNSMISKKIDNLENKISKTLVDTLIDLQSEDAPLLVKKNYQGSDKCGSCNQNLPTLNNNNLINQYNVNNNEPQSLNSSVHKGKFRKYEKKSPDTKNPLLPDINNTKKLQQSTIDASIEKGSPKGSVAKSTEKIQKSLNPSKSMIYLKESEKANDNLNEELEKKIVNPDKIMLANRKMYSQIEKIEKKNK